MPMRSPLFALLLALTVHGCGTPDDTQDTGSEPSPEQLLCEDVCLKAFCDGTLEPDPGVESECTQSCSEQLAEASEQSCSSLHANLTECLDALSCDDYYAWLEQAPGAACIDLEQELADACPTVEVRRDG